MEKGVIVGEAAQSTFGGTKSGPVADGGSAQGNGNSGAGAAAGRELAKAIPEEVRRIAANWPAIVGNAENPMRIYIKSARLSLGADNRLIVALEDGMASDYFTQHPENKVRLEEMLADYSGKAVSVDIQTVKQQQVFEDNFIDISQIVQMEIEEEEE